MRKSASNSQSGLWPCPPTLQFVQYLYLAWSFWGIKTEEFKLSNCETECFEIGAFQVSRSHRSHSCFNDLESLAFIVKGPRVLFLQGANNGQWIPCNDLQCICSKLCLCFRGSPLASTGVGAGWESFTVLIRILCADEPCAQQVSLWVTILTNNKFFYILSVRSPVGWLTWILEHALLVLGCWTWWSIATTKDLSSMTCTGRISP